MTYIGVFTQQYQSEDRSWLLSEFDDCYGEGGTLDVSTFTAGTHYPNGYLPSGTAVGIITASGKLGPYDPAASDGTETCVGLTLGDARILDPIGGTRAAVGVAYTRYNAVVSLARLPFQSGTGSLDAAGQTDLSHVLCLA